MSQPEFIPGLELNRRFYFEAVRPILNTHFPLPHTAAYIGTGSDVLGFDTAMSTDHDWRPAVAIFLRDEDLHYAENILEVMSYNLQRKAEVRSRSVSDRRGHASKGKKY